AQPQVNAEMFRRFEVVAPQGSASSNNANRNLPLLTIADSRASGYTADEDAGVGSWLAEHPTYDGRGVTIALLESAQPAFAQAVFGGAKTLDGRYIPKIAGVLNGLAGDAPDDTRVTLDTEVSATGTWCRIGRRTYILPHPGTYRFGVFRVPADANVVH